MIDPRFVFAGAVFNLVGSSSYALAAFRGRVRPNLVSWVLWTVAPAIGFAAQLSEGVGIRATMTFMIGFGPAIVVVTSLINRKAYWKPAGRDYVCGALSLAAVLLWWLTRTGDVAIALSIAADGLAAVPTVIKAYRFPETEHAMVYIFAAISGVITLLTLRDITFASAGFPLYVVFVCPLVAILIVAKPGTRTPASVRAPSD